MPTVVRVMSWNIESLGDAKATVTNPLTNAVNQSGIIDIINQVIREVDADIVGIMEVKSGRGADILGWLLPRLNNGAAPGVQWMGRVSSRQDGGTQEETLYLWKQQANVLVLDPAGSPAPISSVGIVDADVLATTFASLGIANNAVTQAAFLTALATAGYVGHGRYQGKRNTRPLTLTWRVNANQWNALNTMAPPAAVNFGTTPTPVPVNAAQRRALAAQLIGTDILRFVSYGDRSPYLANFLIGNPAKRVMIGVLHAPGPSDILRTDAINVIGLSTCAAAADNLVLMGDFNIAANQGGMTGVDYGRFMRNGEFTFAQLQPKQVTQVFNPIVGAPLNAPNRPLAPDQRTTVIDKYVDDNTPFASVLGNTYDKFFFRGNATAAQRLTTAHPWNWNMIRHLDSTDADFWQPVGQAALTFFRAFRGDPYLAKADASLAKRHAKAQKTFTQATNRAANIQAKINATHPPLSSQLYTRLSDANAEATKANQTMAAIKMQRDAIAEARSLVTGTGTEPTGVGTALAVYREAISDHFPISLDLRT